MANLDQTSVHRKVFTPWYDGETACFITMAAAAAVLLFAVVGIFVAYEDTASHDCAWVPVTLALMCLWVLLSVGVRLARRYIVRFNTRYSRR